MGMLIGVRKCIKISSPTQVKYIGLIQRHQAFFCLADRVNCPMCQNYKCQWLKASSGQLNVKQSIYKRLNR